ncbi:MAG: nuclear transport factor 2 family protein [Chloroflexota bacterium]
MNTKVSETQATTSAVLIRDTEASTNIAINELNEQLALGQRFLAALARRDFEGLEACFQPDARFRALVPSGVREGIGPEHTVAWFYLWFGTAEQFEMQKMDTERMHDRLHICYRIRLIKEGLLQSIEQQAYCEVTGGRISVMNLLCSGFRPEANS